MEGRWAWSLVFTTLLGSVTGQGDLSAVRAVQTTLTDPCHALEAILQLSNMNDTIVQGGFAANCAAMKAPESLGLSGTACEGQLSASGWLRMGAINQVMDMVLLSYNSPTVLPASWGTNSGGTMFAIRYQVLMGYSGAVVKWTYPCFLLAVKAREICYFHAGFGRLSRECESEFYNTIEMAVAVIYKPVIDAYGGPFGVAANYASLYFPLLATVPIAKKDTLLSGYAQKYLEWNPTFDAPSNWILAYTLNSPSQASDGQENFNYGFDSYLSRGMRAWNFVDGSWTSYDQWYSNMTIATVAATSANTMGGLVNFPISFSGKGWDQATGLSPVGTGMKLVGMGLSYIMVRWAIANYYLGSTNRAPGCTQSCPWFEAGFTDSGPITPILSAASQSPHKTRPTHILVIGSASTMSDVQYIMGTGPLKVLEFSGMNLCPFAESGICDMITQITKCSAHLATDDTFEEIVNIQSMYQQNRPEIQVIAPYCGDPLTFDHFQGQCQTDSMCHMQTVVVPSVLNDVYFLPEEYNVIVSMIYLGNTPVSSRFVSGFIPASVTQLHYYKNMADWFPNFQAFASEKGGAGFTNIAGNSLQDFTTFLSSRLVAQLLQVKIMADQLYRGEQLQCEFKAFLGVASLNWRPDEYLAYGLGQ